tara:strand:- start:1132 stop:1365 length:234 start_codon:yes stop_codon:yes gene_type:complete
MGYGKNENTSEFVTDMNNLIDTLESINVKLGIIADATTQIDKSLKDDSSLDFVKDINGNLRKIAGSMKWIAGSEKWK